MNLGLRTEKPVSLSPCDVKVRGAFSGEERSRGDHHLVMRLKVRDLVESRGLTWKRFAEETGLSKQTVHALMTGKVTRIDLGTLDALCQYFHVNVGDIIEHE